MSTLTCLFVATLSTVVLALPSSSVYRMTFDQNPKPVGYRLSYAPYYKTFLEFNKKFGISYNTPSKEQYRFSIFVDNLKYIEEHNALYHHGNSSFYMNINQFADKTVEEYWSMTGQGHHSKKARKMRQQRKANFYACDDYKPSGLPTDSADWRKEGVVTAVKYQGDCGSSWAFSTTGAIEGSYALLTKQLISFSEQQLVDCCTDCSGCHGGQMDSAFLYINQAGGLETERDYCYTASDDGECYFDASKTVVQVTRCFDVETDDEDSLKDAVGNQGPVSVAVDGRERSFMYYSGGVYSSDDCSSEFEFLSLGVLAVGYGNTDGLDYWLVKNSFGKDWGMEGYIMMSRNNNNNCGIATDGSFPVAGRP